MYESPTTEELREFMARHQLTGSQVGAMVGVDSRTVRKWTASDGAANKRAMPWSAWALLRVIMGELQVEYLQVNRKAILEDVGKKSGQGPSES